MFFLFGCVKSGCSCEKFLWRRIAKDGNREVIDKVCLFDEGLYCDKIQV